MLQKSVEKFDSSKPIQHKIPCFGELSISSIKEQSSTELSVDFSQEKHLLNQMNGSLYSNNDDYGLAKPVEPRAFLRKQNKEQPVCLVRGISLSRLHNFQNEQKNLAFNKQIKRKKITSKSKEKYLSPSSPLMATSSLKHFRSANTLRFPPKTDKEISTNAIPSIKPRVDIKNIVKSPRIALKIYQQPLEFWADRNQQKSFKKIYHHLPDEMKIELNDLGNWHKQFGFNSKMHHEKKQQQEDPFGKSRRQIRSLITVDLKRSRMSKPEEKINRQQHEALSRPAKRSQIYLQSQYKPVVEVSKPLSLDCKNSSFYSSRTQQYQSPISKDTTSTAARTVMRRSQFYRSPQQKCNEYFQSLSRAKNSNK